MSAKKIKYEIVQGCVLCMECVHECPQKAISMGAGSMVINQDKCTGCGICWKNCAFEAIKKTEIN
jgi:ferredoxin